MQIRNAIKNTAVIGLWIAAIAVVVAGIPVTAAADPLYHFDNWGTYTFTNGVDEIEVVFSNGDVDVFEDSTWFRIGGGRMLRVIDAQNGVFAFDWTDNGLTLVNTDVPEVVENETEEPEVEPVVVVNNTTENATEPIAPVNPVTPVVENTTTEVVENTTQDVANETTTEMANTGNGLVVLAIAILCLVIGGLIARRD